MFEYCPSARLPKPIWTLLWSSEESDVAVSISATGLKGEAVDCQFRARASSCRCFCTEVGWFLCKVQVGVSMLMACWTYFLTKFDSPWASRDLLRHSWDDSWLHEQVDCNVLSPFRDHALTIIQSESGRRCSSRLVQA